MASTGTGDIHLVDGATSTERSVLHASEHRWDNHLLSFTV